MKPGSISPDKRNGPKSRPSPLFTLDGVAMRRNFLAIAACGFTGLFLRAQEPAAYLPGDALGAIQLNNLSTLIDRVDKSGIVQVFYSTPQGKEILARPEFKKAMAAKQIVEQQLGMSAVDLAKTLLGGEVGLGVYGKLGGQPDLILVARPGNLEKWKQFLERIQPFLDLAEGPIELSSPAQGVSLVTIKKVGVVAWGDSWLVAGTKTGAVQPVWSQLADSGKVDESKKKTFKALANDPDYRKVRDQLGEKPLVGVYLATKTLKGPLGNRLIPSKLDNPLASLWLGGLIEMAARSPGVGAALTVGEKEFALRVAALGDISKLDAGRRALFPAEGKEGAHPFPAVPGLIGGISWDRDIATWYTNREALLQAKALPGFDVFETGLANILPGKDFGKDVLSTLGRGITLIAVPQDYSHLDGTPGVKLPAFAAVIDLAKPKEGAYLLNLFLQTLSAILNIEAGQQGRQPWVMTSETYKGVQITYADYLNKPKGKDLPVVNNFTPAAAVVGDKYLLCSSRGICKQLVDALSAPVDRKAGLPKAEDWAVSGPRLADALGLNKALLEAGSIRNGRTENQAREEIQALDSALRQVEKLRLSSIAQSWGVELRLEGSWK